MLAPSVDEQIHTHRMGKLDPNRRERPKSLIWETLFYLVLIPKEQFHYLSLASL